ncbi:MAG: DNA repair protein RecN [Candidatus Omnitrophota bacterium]
MISQLTIQNAGLIDKLTIEFKKHLNILTGETGAGKSILLDALRFALGERVNTSLVRNPELPCVVEVIFEIPKKLLSGHEAFAEYFSGEKEMIISRGYFPDGRSKAKINGFTVTMAELKSLGDHLVDFHGPHDHQLLFSPDFHIGMLDRLSDIEELKDAYKKEYQKYTGLLKKQKELEEIASSREREFDTLTAQIKELESVPLDKAKYEELMCEQKRLDNSEKIYECVNALMNTMENEEAGIDEIIRGAFSSMKTLNGIDESTAGFAEQLEKLQVASAELINGLSDYRDNLSFDSETAADINRRCDIYFEIKRKYGPALETARKFYEDAKERYELMSDFEQNSEVLNKEIEAIKKQLEISADEISRRRGKTAVSLKKTIEKELTELGIKNVKFECHVKKIELNSEGCDSVEFYISPNVGEEMKPLADIVSSGEAARVMLALKKALVEVDPVPVLIFDEIDAQIGGRLGTITGRKLKELSFGRQVILITHLPQIASFADAHYKVVKTVTNNRTITNIEFLEGETKVRELAKMMSGEKENKISIQHAREMLEQAIGHGA